MWRNWKPHTHIHGRPVKFTAAVEGCRGIPQKVKHKVTILLSNSIPRNVPNRSENLCSDNTCTWT